MAKTQKSRALTILLTVLVPIMMIGIFLVIKLPTVSTIADPIKTAIRRRTVREPLQISQIVVNPKNPKIVYASSHFYGMWKSTNGGESWRHVMKGLGTTDVYGMAIHPENPDTLFAATTGGGIYRSVDGATSWVEVNEGLTDAHVEEMAFDPADPNILYAATMRELFKSTDGGLSWSALFEEDRFVAEDTYMHTLLVIRVPATPEAMIFIGSPRGGFRRAESEDRWEALREKVAGSVITTFAFDSGNQTVYAGAMAKKGFYKSVDAGETWERVSNPPAMHPFRIVVDPTNSQVIYLGSKGEGIFKSEDGGRTWKNVSDGLSHKTIKGLAIDPKNPQRLYAGAPSMIAFSSDGGSTWRTVDIDLPSYQKVVDSLSYINKTPKGTPSPPRFWQEKCNHCHGWTDAHLNYLLPSYWRVSPTRRDWNETVDRMAFMARPPLTLEEKETVLAYLNTYYGSDQKRSGGTDP